MRWGGCSAADDRSDLGHGTKGPSARHNATRNFYTIFVSAGFVVWFEILDGMCLEFNRKERPGLEKI